MRAYRRRSSKKRNVTKQHPEKRDGHWESEAKRLKQEVLRLSRQVAALKQPHHSMAIVVDKVRDDGKPTRYVARHLGGSEWDQGVSPKEALGALVFSYAISRPVTVESLEFSF